MRKPIRRLFVDPATQSTGWAMFEDERLISHGTILVEGGDVHDRLVKLFNRYEALAAMLEIDSAIVERMNHIVSYKVVWACGVIATALRKGRPGIPVDQLSPQTWQKHLKLLGLDRPAATRLYGCKSEDETTAILMGLAYLFEGEKGE